MNESVTGSSSEIRRGRDLLNLPVYTIDDGKSVGYIDSLFVRRENLCVAWVRLTTGPLGGHRFAPYDAFQILGVDIALVPTDAALRDEIPDDEKNALDTGLTGRSVLTLAGQQVGSLMGFEIDPASGKISGFRVRQSAGFFHSVVAAVRDDTVLVPAEGIASLGPDAVILHPDAVSQFVANGGAEMPAHATALGASK
jgi:sporulation protein YlmC with PRC-barrel domain